jgi:hypothetical protein
MKKRCAGAEMTRMDVRTLTIASRRNPHGTSETMEKRAGIHAHILAIMRKAHYIVTWVIMIMVATWEIIVPRPMVIAPQFVMFHADQMKHIVAMDMTRIGVPWEITAHQKERIA